MQPLAVIPVHRFEPPACTPLALDVQFEELRERKAKLKAYRKLPC